MKRMGWIALDFVLAAIVAVLGNIVASYLQERLSLTDPVRFTFVAILFVVCLGLLLLATLKRSHLETHFQEDDMGRTGAQVRQQIERVEREGEVTGLESEKIPSSMPVGIEQKAKTVAGKMTGMRLGRFNKTHSEDDEG